MNWAWNLAKKRRERGCCKQGEEEEREAASLSEQEGQEGAAGGFDKQPFDVVIVEPETLGTEDDDKVFNGRGFAAISCRVCQHQH